jgi:hypothetical protein
VIVAASDDQRATLTRDNHNISGSDKKLLPAIAGSDNYRRQAWPQVSS